MKEGLQKELMIQLLYPAILGSILYQFFDFSYGAILDFSSPDNSQVVLKLVFLVVAFVFYGSDYWYAKFSNDYNWWFFAANFFFLCCMFIGVKALNVGEVQGINYVVLIATYFSFLIVYLFWDVTQYLSSSGKERCYYKEVIAWEVLSILFVAVNFFVNNNYLFALTLILSTIWFVIIAIRKPRFYNEPKTFDNQ